MTRNVVLIVFSFLLLIACGDDRQTDTRHDDIRACATECYGYLIKGDIDAYVSQIHDYDSLPDEYQSQMRDLFAQYLANEQRLHRGLVDARVVGDTILDSVRADAFVEVSYGDSTCEQVSLPLVLKNGKWMLK